LLNHVAQAFSLCSTLPSPFAWSA